MTDKEKLLHLAAKVDQLGIEFEALAREMGFFAGHETMVAKASLLTASYVLMKTARRLND